MTLPEPQPCIGTEPLRVKVSKIQQSLDRLIDYTGPLDPYLEVLGNRLEFVHTTYFPVATAKHDRGIHRQTCQIQRCDARLEELAVTLRRAYVHYIGVLRKVASAAIRRKGLRDDIPGSITLANIRIFSLDDVIRHLTLHAKSDLRFIPAASASAGVSSEANHPDGSNHNYPGDDAGAVLQAPADAKSESERKAGQHRQHEETKDAAVWRLAQSIKDQAQKQADSEARWKAEIAGLRTLLGDQQRQIETMRGEKVAAAEDESVKREDGLALLRNELQVQKIEAEKAIEAEVKGLKEELSALRATVSASNGTNHTGIVNSLTKVDAELLGRLILSSDPFTSAIPRLLRLTIGHTLALSVGCFPVDHPERVLQISNACDSHHTLAALGVLHDLPSWAGERDQIFRQLVKEALEGEADAEPDCTELDMAMLSMLGAQPGKTSEREEQEEKGDNAEEHEKLKSAWKDIVGAVNVQGQSTLGEITQHLALAIDHITSAKAEALLSIDRRHQATTLDLGHRADQLDQAMLEFDRLHSGYHSAPALPIAQIESIPISPSPNQDFSTVITLLEQLVLMQQPSSSLIPVSSNSPPTPLRPSPSTTSLDTTHALATGSSSIHSSANAALNTAAGPRVTGPIWTDDLWYSPARVRM